MRNTHGELPLQGLPYDQNVSVCNVGESSLAYLWKKSIMSGLNSAS